MDYPICRKCKKSMVNVIDTEISDSAFDGVSRIYKCECGEKCQAIYNFEHITPTDIFWND